MWPLWAYLATGAAAAWTAALLFTAAFLFMALVRLKENHEDTLLAILVIVAITAGGAGVAYSVYLDQQDHSQGVRRAEDPKQ